jgi:hypothetical protein
MGFCDDCDGFCGCITVDNYHSLIDHTLCNLLYGWLVRICTTLYVLLFKFTKLIYFTARVVDTCDFLINAYSAVMELLLYLSPIALSAFLIINRILLVSAQRIS